MRCRMARVGRKALRKAASSKHLRRSKPTARVGIRAVSGYPLGEITEGDSDAKSTRRRCRCRSAASSTAQRIRAVFPRDPRLRGASCHAAAGTAPAHQRATAEDVSRPAGGGGKLCARSRAHIPGTGAAAFCCWRTRCRAFGRQGSAHLFPCRREPNSSPKAFRFDTVSDLSPRRRSPALRLRTKQAWKAYWLPTQLEQCSIFCGQSREPWTGNIVEWLAFQGEVTEVIEGLVTARTGNCVSLETRGLSVGRRQSSSCRFWDSQVPGSIA